MEYINTPFPPLPSSHSLPSNTFTSNPHPSGEVIITITFYPFSFFLSPNHYPSSEAIFTPHRKQSSPSSSHFSFFQLAHSSSSSLYASHQYHCLSFSLSSLPTSSLQTLILCGSHQYHCLSHILFLPTLSPNPYPSSEAILHHPDNFPSSNALSPNPYPSADAIFTTTTKTPSLPSGGYPSPPSTSTTPSFPSEG